MCRFRIATFVMVLAAGFAVPGAAKPALAADPLPKGERRAVAEIRRLADDRRFADADSLALALIVRAGTEKGARMLPEALDLRADVLMRWARPNDPEFAVAARRAAEAREAMGASDPVKLAASLQTLGIAKLRRFEYPLADSLFTRALATLETASPRDERAIAGAMTWLAEGRRVVKKLKPAEEAATGAIAALERVAPPDTSAVVRAHVTLGNTYAEMGQADRSVAALERALALEESRARPDSVTIAATCRNLGRAQNSAGNNQLSIGLYERAAGIQERVLGSDHLELAQTLYLLSANHLDDGDFVAAYRTAERALQIRERVFGPDHQQVAVALWQLAGALRELGDLDAALAANSRSVEIMRTGSATPADLATALSNLGVAYLARGDGRRARESFDQAIAIRERVFGPGSGRGFWAVTRVAQAMTLEGRSLEAETVLDTLFASRTRRTPFDVAETMEELGIAACANGSLDKANACFDSAFAIHDSLLGIASPRTLESLSFRAAARWAMGRRDDALADACRYERAALDFIRSTARGLSEHEALSFEGARASGRDILLTLAADSTGLQPEARAAVLDAVVRSRLAVLDELADEARALPRRDPALAPLVRDLEEARAALAQAMVAALRESRPPDSMAAVARMRRGTAERVLAERSDAFRAIARRGSAGAPEVIASLPRGSALVSFVRYHSPRRILDAGTPAGKNAATAQYAALLLRAGQRAPAIIPLGAAVELEPMVDRWVAALATPPPATLAGAIAAQRRCDAIGRAIRAQVWDLVAKHMTEAERVFIVPDGALHRINFAALPDTGGGYLAESGPLIHRLTAERDLLPWEARATEGRGLLALGGADFERSGGAPEPLAAAIGRDAENGIRVRSSIPDSLRVRFTALPQTAAEVAEVGKLWREGGSGESLELTGAAASEAAFKRLASGRRVIHLATHGFALGSPATRAPQGTRGIGAVGSGDRPGAKRAAALLPGLALAGANVVAVPPEEDGFLTDEEITALDLASVDWAVLSACETGLSDPDAVEAVQGLHRSFRRAGVRTVIMSLWAVDDAATRAWMKQLYTSRLRRKADTATAVREASRALLAERRASGLDLHPFHWAAFVAAGDWR